MKVRASIKKRNEDCKIVRRKGRLYVINKKIPSSNSVRDKKSINFAKKLSNIWQ